jgi:hypothetical protein
LFPFSAVKLLPLLFPFAFALLPALADSVVVLNELHYHPAGAETPNGEWLELRNQMAVDVDVSGWSLAEGVDFSFPEGTIIPARGYLVVAATPSTIPGSLGPWTGRLDNSGEEVELHNNNGRVMDQLDYEPDGDWPVAPDGAGFTLARRGANLATDEAWSWAASRQTGGTPGADNFPAVAPVTTPVIGFAETWKVFSAGSPPAGWKDAGFNDSGWASGSGTFRLGTATLPAPATVGSSLPSGPASYLFRKSFAFSGQPAATQLRLRLLADDGAAVFLNGVELARVNLTADAGPLDLALQPRRADPAIQEFMIPGSLLVNGSNQLAVEIHQAAMLPSYPQAVINSGPVAYWRLGESAGTVADLADLAPAPESGAQVGSYAGLAAADLGTSGPRPTDTVGGAPLVGFEETNAAPHFQGGGDGGNDVALFPDPGALNFSAGKKFSFEAWVKVPASGFDSGGAVIAKGTGGGGEQFACDLASGKYRFFVWSGGSPNASFVAQSNVAPNDTWQHLAGVFDQSQGLMKLYVNGVQAASATPPATLLSTTHEVSVGARKNSGSAAYDLNLLGKVDEVALYNRALTTTEITAHYNAAFASSPNGQDTTDAVFGLALDTVTTPAPVALVFNEVTAGTSGPIVELANPGAAAVALGGCKISRLNANGTQNKTLGAQTLPAGGVASFTSANLGFNLADGDRLVLLSASGAALDGVEVKANPRGRSPDGSGEWYRLTATTFGVANVVALHDEIVIHEIMFHPPAPPLSPAVTGGQWIELSNRSAHAVDLTGWRLDGGIEFDFPAGTTLAAGGYLVVADNPASLPGVGALGPWSGSLSRNNDRIVLEDSLGNRADEAAYFSGGHWSDYADGGGSSLELLDPAADRLHPQSWAASDETGKAAWQTFTWRGLADPGVAGEPTQWNEIDLCLTDGPGEVLIDDVRVTDLTTGQNLIQNGGFNNGINKWRAVGTHRQSLAESEAGGNQVLHVIATGPGEYQGNQLESTFLNNTPLASGREYEISLRARWLAGAGRLNARLYHDRLARTHDLAVVPRGGTPGAPNSRSVANLGPSVSGLAHLPAVPAAFQPFVVFANIADPDGVSAAALKFAVDGGAWQSVPMTNDGAHFSATVPGQAAAAIVQFYVEATDAEGAVSQYPPGGPASRALCAIEDGQAAAGPTAKFRLVMLPADATFMHAEVNCLSNAPMPATVIADEGEIYYDVGARLKGSYVGRNIGRVGFNVRFQPDQLFRGVHDKVAIDRSQHAAIAQGEILVKHIASKAGGIPNMYDDLARFVHVLPTYTSSCQLRVTGFEGDFLDSSFPDGDDGPMFEYEGIRWSTATSDGTPEGIKVPGTSSSYVNLDLQDRGDSEESYRWNWLLTKDRDADDFSAAISTAKLFSLTGAALDAEARLRLDVDQWLRALALQTLVGPGDTLFTGSNVHNIRFYQRPHDARMMYMPWDWDSCWQRSTSASLIAGTNVAKLVNATPHNQRQFLFHVHDLVNSTFNTTYMTRWTQHYGTVSGDNYSSILTYIGNRATYALSQVPTATAWSSAAGTVNSNGAVTLSGNGNIRIASIEVNGLAYAPVWTSTTAWSVVVPLAAGANTLVVRGLDKSGQLVSGATSTLNVTNPNEPGWPAIRINEWMADNDGSFTDPADGESDDWIELHNPTDSPVNLSNWSLSDTPSKPRLAVLPNGTMIPARGFLLLWADDQPAQGSAAVPHLAFKLSQAGDSIRLHAPDTRLIDSVSFGAQDSGLTDGRYLDGSDGIFPLTEASPASANVLLYRNAPEVADGAFHFSFSTTPGRRYRVECSENLTDWVPLTSDVLATGVEMEAIDPLGQNNRFYRAVLLPE